MFLSVDSDTCMFGLKVHGEHGISDVSNTVVAPLKIPRITRVNRKPEEKDPSFTQIRNIVIGVVSAVSTVVTAVGSFFGCKRCKKKGKSESYDVEGDNKSGMLH